jgi:peptidoglycan/LPS O-acetylase OafA/YrhL
LSHVPAIDGLRAVAILSVMVFHLRPAWLPGGFVGVDIFFVISGFVVTGSLMGRRFDSRRQMLRDFYARRLIRIVPALVVMLVVTALMTQLFVPQAWLSGRIPNVAVGASVGLANMVLAFDPNGYFAPKASYNPFLHSWSLGVEEQFYLLFPFLLWRRQRLDKRAGSSQRVMLAVAGLSLASFLAGAVLPQGMAFYLIVSRFWELGVGVLLCLGIEAWQGRLAALQDWQKAALGWGGTALLAIAFAIPESALLPFPLALLPVLGSACVIGLICAAPDAAVARLLCAAPLVRVGLLSYSLYLWHYPVFVLFRWTIGLDTAITGACAAILALGLAGLSYRLAEKPFRVGSRIALARHASLVGLGASAMLACGAACAILFSLHDQITLSVTRDHRSWYAEAGRPLDPARTYCRVSETGSRLGSGTVTHWVPTGCRLRPVHIHAVGDSHNVAYVPAYRQLAAEHGIAVSLYDRASCPVFKLTETMASRPECAGFYAALLATLKRDLRPGDIVFMPALRMTRITNQFGSDWPPGSTPPTETADPAAIAEARMLLATLTRTGARLVFEAPKPMFASPAFRCADWFNRANPICQPGLEMSRALLLERQHSVRESMKALAAENGAIRIWDPFPILCPTSRCQMFRDGKPLYFDADHLSGAGNDLLYPSLSAALLAR